MKGVTLLCAFCADILTLGVLDFVYIFPWSRHAAAGPPTSGGFVITLDANERELLLRRKREIEQAIAPLTVKEKDPFHLISEADHAQLLRLRVELRTILSRLEQA